MSISAFRNAERERAEAENESVLPYARRRYRALKRHEAEVRQAAFDAEVAKAMHDHNVSEPEARRVVVARRRFEHKRAERAA